MGQPPPEGSDPSRSGDEVGDDAKWVIQSQSREIAVVGCVPRDECRCVV